MQDADLKQQSFEDLLAIEGALNKDAHPDRYALAVAEIDARDKAPVPPPLPDGRTDYSAWERNVRPPYASSLTKTLLGVGLLLGAGGLIMEFSKAQTVLAARPWVDMAGDVLFLAGCVTAAKTKGRSGWFGVFGLLGIIGLALLCDLKNKPRSLRPLQQN